MTKSNQHFNNKKDDGLDSILKTHGYNLEAAQAFQRVWADNWFRFLAVTVGVYVTLVLTCFIGFSTLSNETSPAFLSFFMAAAMMLPLAMSPEPFMIGESFLFKWKAKRLKKIFLKSYGINLSKKMVKKNELYTLECLEQMIEDFSTKYNLKDLCGEDNKSFWENWSNNFNNMSQVGGWVKFLLYTQDNYINKHFTEISFNDVIKTFQDNDDFNKSIYKIMVNRKYKISEIHQLLDCFFIAIQVSEYVSQYNSQPSGKNGEIVKAGSTIM